MEQIKIKEVDYGSWGWYFDEDKKLLLNKKEFFKSIILISLKYGINLSTFGIENNLKSAESVDEVVDRIFDIVADSEGNPLLKAINYNFYSMKFSTRIMASVIYSKEGSMPVKYIYNDFFSMLFCTLKKENLHSFFYNLRSNAFGQVDNNDMLFYTNTTRFNSYIRSLHQLMQKFDASLFDCTFTETNSPFGISKKGYFLDKDDECIFYEDIYDLLPIELRYTPMEMINNPMV